MAALAIDLGGTKLSFAVFSQQGELRNKKIILLNKKSGNELGELIVEEVHKITRSENIGSIGVAVPGIYRSKTGTVWAPNIEGWEDYPLLRQLREAVNIPVVINSDRACYILGEWWQGNAKGCSDVIYLAVGTGIGAGILTGGKVLQGAHDIAGAIGWLALQQPFQDKYISCGCFEYHASGTGIVNVTRELLVQQKEYKGELAQQPIDQLTAHDVFAAYEKNDELAKGVFDTCIRFWGMAVANLVSLFNPEKIILGGGIFGPGLRFAPAIQEEAARWAQPISMQQVSIEPSALGTDAGLYGAGWLAFNAVNPDHVQ